MKMCLNKSHPNVWSALNVNVFGSIALSWPCWSSERSGAVQWKAGKYAVVLINGPVAIKEEIEW